MSGFAFHVRCDGCGLASGIYPLRYDRVVAPSWLELPTANRRDGAFGRLSLPVTRALSEDELARIAAVNSSDHETVLVPTLGADGVSLAPAVACPRCAMASVSACFGRPPLAWPIVTSLDELIARTRSLAPGDVVKVELASPRTRVGCTRGEDGTSWSWHFTHEPGVDLEPVVGELASRLTAAGRRCSAPRHAPGYSELEETTQ